MTGHLGLVSHCANFRNNIRRDVYLISFEFIIKILFPVGDNANLQDMMIADITLEQFKDALNWGHQYVKENTIATCESVLYIVCVPVILGNGGCLVLPTKAICTAFQLAIYSILNALSIAAEIAYRALHYTYDYKVNQSICMPIAYQFCLSLSCIMPSLFATKN